MVWISEPADADRLIAEAKQEQPGRKIIAISWSTSTENSDFVRSRHWDE
jgi:hypothetical protein